MRLKEPTASWRLEETSDEVKDVVSEQDYDENIELLQAEKLILYRPMEAAAKLLVLRDRYENTNPKLSYQIQHDLAEASIQLLSPLLERAAYAGVRLKEIRSKQKIAMAKAASLIDQDLYDSLLKHLQEATTICGRVFPAGQHLPTTYR